MTEKTDNKFNWRLPLYGVLGATTILLPKMILGNDIGTILLTIVIAVIASFIMVVVLIRTIRRQSLAALSMLAVFCVASLLLFKVSDDVHTSGRWLIHSNAYKAQVLSQPNSTNGELKHVEWDSWGFAGSGNTVVYLVSDPQDLLAGAAKSHSPGKFNGIPCNVRNVQQLDNHWYTVLFYTDSDWDNCN